MKVSHSTWLLALLPLPALAHLGHSHLNNFGAGILHPLSGLDHAMLLVAAGAWLALQRNLRVGGEAGLALLGALAVGVLVGKTWHGFAHEALITLTLLAAGLACAIFKTAPKALIWSAVAAAGAIHGVVHGAELGTATQLFAPGLVLGSAAILSGTYFICRPLIHYGCAGWIQAAGAGAAFYGAFASL